MILNWSNIQESKYTTSVCGCDSQYLDGCLRNPHKPCLGFLVFCLFVCFKCKRIDLNCKLLCPEQWFCCNPLNYDCSKLQPDSCQNTKTNGSCVTDARQATWCCRKDRTATTKLQITKSTCSTRHDDMHLCSLDHFIFSWNKRWQQVTMDS